MKLNIVFGGKAGQGPNILSEVVSDGLIDRGFYVFYSRDYQSLIRGGHNFNILTFSDKAVYSNSSRIDILVCLDESTLIKHKASLNKTSIILEGQNGNMFFAGSIYKLLGLDFFELERQLRKLKNFEENIVEARKGYNSEKRTLSMPSPLVKLTDARFINGNKAIVNGAINSGLEYYYAYPMTPATPVMMDLGQMQLDKNSKHKVIELENEIAVILAAMGSSTQGKRSMVGTAGGGFDLMTEALSFAGQAEIPLVIYLSQRPGPGTGVATYSSQGDLNLALYSGHGEFQRVVIAPGDVLESEEATNLCFYLSQKFRIPAIVLGDKHLGESKSIVRGTAKIVPITNTTTTPERFNSYEFDRKQDNIATEEASVIKANFDKRMKKQKEIEKEVAKFEMFKVYGNVNSKNLIIGFGSTKGAIIDVLENCETMVDAKFIQILFLDPFPSEKIKAELTKAKKVVIVENNSTSQLADLITKKTGFIIETQNKVLRYDGRPFFSDELADELKKRIK